jgi:hypothetical protein
VGSHSPLHRRAVSVVGGRSRAAVVGAVAGLVVLTGCASNFSAQTQQRYQPAEGVSNRLGQVFVIDALIVEDGKGNGTLDAAFINQQAGADALDNVSVTDGAGKPVKVVNVTGAPLPLPPQHSVQVAYSGVIRLSGTPETVKEGTFVTIRFTFNRAAPLTEQIPVVPHDAEYAQVPVGPAGSASRS